MVRCILRDKTLLNFQICRYNGFDSSIVTFKEQAAIIIHVDDAACFFDGSFAGIPVLVGAVMVYDDGAAGADELVHALPSFDPWANAEGFELSDGAFEIPDKRLQKLFAIDWMPEDFFERGDGAIQVRIIGRIAIDVYSDTH